MPISRWTQERVDTAIFRAMSDFEWHEVCHFQTPREREMIRQAVLRKARALGIVLNTRGTEAKGLMRIKRERGEPSNYPRNYEGVRG